MTREEAKGIFEDLRGYKIILSDLSANEQEELWDMAISALKEPTWQEKLEKEYLFESIKEDMTKLKVENERLLKEVEILKSFDGMTHRDILKALFPIDENKGARLTKVYIDHEPIESFALTTTQKWLDSPYKGVSE